ncbi:hypothetical protein O988_02947 [Pseudogymnoascus sp. VKM F-3808]|nr:hypothetical protein O988_02947 [Pseudogymnoascus sp. VKM F-3808]
MKKLSSDREQERVWRLFLTRRERKTREVNLPSCKWSRVGASKPYTPGVRLAPASSKLGGRSSYWAAEKGHADDVVIVYSRELNCLPSTWSFSTVYFNQLYSVRRHLNFDIKEQWRQPS